MEDKIIILEGENYTFKSLEEIADKDNRKVLIVDNIESVTKHQPTLNKIGVTCSGFVLVCISQLLESDRKKLEQPKPAPDSLTQEIIDLFSKFDERMLIPCEVKIEHKKEVREVKHAQAKPVKQFIPNHKNHQFKRK
jgi:hypothetical protein